MTSSDHVDDVMGVDDVIVVLMTSLVINDDMARVLACHVVQLVTCSSCHVGQL